MELLPTILEMRKNLTSQCQQLTRESTLKEQQAYVDALCHYRKIWTRFVERQNMELTTAINKGFQNINTFNESRTADTLVPT